MKVLRSWMLVNSAALAAAVTVYVLVPAPAKLEGEQLLLFPVAVGAGTWLLLAVARNLLTRHDPL